MNNINRKFLKRKNKFLFLFVFLTFFNVNIFSMDNFWNTQTKKITSSDDNKTEEQKNTEKLELEKLNSIKDNKTFDYKNISDEDYNLLIKNDNWKKIDYENLLKFKDFITNNKNTDDSNIELIRKIEEETNKKNNEIKILHTNKIQEEFQKNENTFNLITLSSDDIKKQITTFINEEKFDEAKNFFEKDLNHKRLNIDDLNSIADLFSKNKITEFNEKIEEQRNELIKNEKVVVSADPNLKKETEKNYYEHFKDNIENMLGTSIKGLQEIANSN